MDDKHIHVISFDVPYPADYGGVIDVYYKIKALFDAGVKVHLHCFEYGRAHSSVLDEICHSVNYYKRQYGIKHIFSSLPYIVSTRQSNELLNNLLKDDYPILFEGLHTCFYLQYPQLQKRKKFVRTHNIEHDYYLNLAKVEHRLLKKIFFKNESKKLLRFEKKLKHANVIFSISTSDANYLSGKYSSVFHLPAFHSFSNVNAKTGLGMFALYHGNLSVGENNEAALYLVNNIFNDISFNLTIAGNNPSSELVKLVSKFPNITLQANISTQKINELIANAQINILPTFQSTGIKLKLLAALFSGRHCIVNSPMVLNTGLEELCVVVDSDYEMKRRVNELCTKIFNEKELDNRKKILGNKFSNNENIQMLINLL